MFTQNYIQKKFFSMDLAIVLTFYFLFFILFLIFRIFCECFIFFICAKSRFSRKTIKNKYLFFILILSQTSQKQKKPTLKSYEAAYESHLLLHSALILHNRIFICNFCTYLKRAIKIKLTKNN